MGRKCLVAYFSVSGTTKNIAKKIAEIADADLFEIKAKQPYSDSDLNWNDKNSRCTKEMKDKSIRPEIEDTVNIDDYDVIYLGYPIWWEKAPNIIWSFLESYNFTGKTMIPFSTSGGSIKGSVGMHLHKHCSKDTQWKNGKLFHQSISDREILEWINKKEK